MVLQNYFLSHVKPQATLPKPHKLMIRPPLTTMSRFSFAPAHTFPMLSHPKVISTKGLCTKDVHPKGGRGVLR